MKTAAAVAHGLRTPFVVEDIELPDLQDTEVLIRIVAVGVCHTDLASLDGQLPAPFPAIFGHEGAGVVERVGDRVRKVIPGGHVVLAPDSDGTCEQCAAGAPTYCERFLELNFQAGTNGRTAALADGRRASIKYFGQSSFAHHAVVSERSVVTVRKDLPLKLLGPPGCGIQTGAGTVMNGLRPQRGSSMAIRRAGAVGLAAILGAVVSGCAKIIAVDRNDTKLELAKRLGATDTINTKQVPDLGSSIRSVVPRGVNFLVDAAGVDALIGTALTSLAKRGTLGLVAVPPSAEKKVDVPWASVLLQGQTVRGFMEGNSIPDIFIPQMLDLYAQGRFRSTTSCAYTHSLTSTAQSRINAMELQSSRSSKWLPHDLER
jgi:aryl-alcohol dehydrogenase